MMYLKILILFGICGCCLSVPLGISTGDVCGALEGRRYYLNVGNSATLFVKNLEKGNVDFRPSRRIPAFIKSSSRRMKREDIANQGVSLNTLFENGLGDLEINAQTEIHSKDIASMDAASAAKAIYSDTSNLLTSFSEAIQSVPSLDKISNRGEALNIGAENDSDTNLDNINLLRISNPLNLMVKHAENIQEDEERVTIPDQVGSLSSLMADSGLKDFTVIENPNDALLPTTGDPDIEYVRPVDNNEGGDKLNSIRAHSAKLPVPYIIENSKINPQKNQKIFNNIPTQGQMTPFDSDELQMRCGVEIFTCQSCHLEFYVEEIRLPSCSDDDTCKCDYIHLAEPPYDHDIDICSSNINKSVPVFITQTSDATLDFFYSQSHEAAFVIKVQAIENNYIIKETNSGGGIIKTPFFPELYPKAFAAQYEIFAPHPDYKIKILFEDFMIAPWSEIEIHDTNKSRVAAFNGKMEIFRPPVLVSSGPQVSMIFKANGNTHRGLKLHYSFIPEYAMAQLPITNCGGYVMNFGGVITMMNMTSVFYDCIWIIQPPRDYAYKSHISIRVDQFHAMEMGTVLEIRNGLTSNDYILESLESGITEPRRSQEHVVSAETGFYVRLRGFFSDQSKLAIVYSSFSYLGNCYTLTDLMCHNHRCVPKLLKCDGFDHCGDNSDEPVSCYGGPGGKLTPRDAAWWYQHTPNYHFPQKDNNIFNPEPPSGLVLLTSLITMIFVIIGLVSYLVKQGNIQNAQRQRRERRQVTSINDGVEIFDASADDPPGYEAPPDYEEVVKFILSGNNLKLVRRPGGVTAWVPDQSKINETSSNQESLGSSDISRHSSRRILRTRHASLDLEQGVEVVLYDPNSHTNRNNNTNQQNNQQRIQVPSPPPVPLIEMRRTSLPITVVSEVSHGHSLSMASSVIHELPEINSRSPSQIGLQASENQFIAGTSGDESPNLLRNIPRNIAPGSISSNQSSIRSNVSQVPRKKRGKKNRKRRSAGPLPPSYEAVMIQKSEELNSPRSLMSYTETSETSESEMDVGRRRRIENRDPTPSTSKYYSIDESNVNRSTNENGNNVASFESRNNIRLSINENRNNITPSPNGNQNNVLLDSSSSPCPSNKIDQIDTPENMIDSNITLNRGGKYASAKSRVNAARELFKRLNDVEIDEKENRRQPNKKLIKPRSKSNDSRLVNKFAMENLNGRESINSNIIKGTVKNRTAMLLKSTSTKECSCNGACSCATFNKMSKSTEISSDVGDNQSYLSDSSIYNELPSTSNKSSARSDIPPEKRLKKNKSVPSLQMIKNRDLDIFFSQCNDMASPGTDDMECPLITPPTNRHRSKDSVIIPMERSPSPKIGELVKFYSTIESEKENGKQEGKVKSCIQGSITSLEKSGGKILQRNKNDKNDKKSDLSYSPFTNIDIPSPEKDDMENSFADAISKTEQTYELSPNKSTTSLPESGAVPKIKIKPKTSHSSNNISQSDTVPKDGFKNTYTGDMGLRSEPKDNVLDEATSSNIPNSEIMMLTDYPDKSIQSSKSTSPIPLPRSRKSFESDEAENNPIYENVLDIKSKQEKYVEERGYSSNSSIQESTKDGSEIVEL